MLMRCDRCHELFDGDESENMTAGWYNVAAGFWALFANEYETVVCDDCMWKDPRYVAIYGPRL